MRLAAASSRVEFDNSVGHNGTAPYEAPFGKTLVRGADTRRHALPSSRKGPRTCGKGAGLNRCAALATYEPPARSENVQINILERLRRKSRRSGKSGSTEAKAEMLGVVFQDPPPQLALKPPRNTRTAGARIHTTREATAILMAGPYAWPYQEGKANDNPPWPLMRFVDNELHAVRAIRRVR